ncbi:MAG: hypothetical protein SGI73_15235 [Chloroflexota bacterium]|nr:hypothetical protein [Chloroflexota bacterium]
MARTVLRSGVRCGDYFLCRSPLGFAAIFAAFMLALAFFESCANLHSETPRLAAEL